MLPQEETDLSFADFGGPKRLRALPQQNGPGLSDRGQWEYLERETGFAGQPSWPSARDCVAANRRPLAWEGDPRARS